MKKVINLEKIQQRRCIVEQNETYSALTTLTYKGELTLLHQLYLNKPVDRDKCMKRHIQQKINGYRSQDIKKNRLNVETLVTYEQCIEKMVISKLTCFYCTKKMRICYENVRDPLQWTLDRINNNIGHSDDNVCICCLKCNLQRRVKNSNDFKFTKQMKLVKLDS